MEFSSLKKSYQEGHGDDAEQGWGGQNSSSKKAVVYFGLIVKLLQIAGKLFFFPDLGD